MDYLIQNASELLRLAGALALVGFFILCLFLCRTIIISTRVLKKAYDLTDIIITYISKPLVMIMKAEKTINQIVDRMKK